MNRLKLPPIIGFMVIVAFGAIYWQASKGRLVLAQDVATNPPPSPVDTAGASTESALLEETEETVESEACAIAVSFKIKDENDQPIRGGFVEVVNAQTTSLLDENGQARISNLNFPFPFNENEAGPLEPGDDQIFWITDGHGQSRESAVTNVEFRDIVDGSTIKPSEERANPQTIELKCNQETVAVVKTEPAAAEPSSPPEFPYQASVMYLPEPENTAELEKRIEQSEKVLNILHGTLANP